MTKPILPYLLLTAALISSGLSSATASSSKDGLRKTGQDAIIHKPSRIQFPEKIGHFTRQDTELNGNGSISASASYRATTPGSMTAKVEVSPSPKIPLYRSPDIVQKASRITMTDHLFDEEKKKIVDAHDGVKQISNGKIKGIKVNGEKSVFGRYAAFEYMGSFDGQKQMLTSRLYLFTYFDGKWTIQYRITHPKGAVPDQAAHSFLKRYKWR